jgi:hypothetical protein
MNPYYLVFAFLLLFHPVTWKDVYTFLEKDHTNWQQFTGEHNCEAFSKDLRDAGQENGIQFFRVRVNFENGAAHIFNAVETSDLGIVYIEPQADMRYAEPKVSGYLCDNSSGICWIAEGMKIVAVMEYDR